MVGALILNKSRVNVALTNFWSMIPFYIPSKQKKTKDFLVLSEGVK